MSSTKLFRKTKKLPWQKVQGEILILDGDEQLVHELNETAAYIWEQIDQVDSIEQLVDYVIDEFDVEADVANQDISAFVDSMVAVGLLTDERS